MSRLRIAYFVLIVSFILMVINLSEFDFNDFSKNHYSGLVSNILLIASMTLTIRDLKKQK